MALDHIVTRKPSVCLDLTKFEQSRNTIDDVISIFLSPLQSKACPTFEIYSHMASTFKSEDSFSSTIC